MKNTLKNLYHKYNKNYQKIFLDNKEFQYLEQCKNILDLGCGEGSFIACDPKKTTGLDSNKKSIAICKRKNFKVKLGIVTRLPFKNNSFDGVHCAHVIEHLDPKSAHKMLSEAERVLINGGIFVISTPILWKGFYNDFTHIKPYYPESIIRYMSSDNAEQKTLNDFKYKFKKVDLYWRYRPILPIGKIGCLISNYLYQFGIHSFIKDAYTLVLKKS